MIMFPRSVQQRFQCGEVCVYKGNINGIDLVIGDEVVIMYSHWQRYRKNGHRKYSVMYKKLNHWHMVSWIKEEDLLYARDSTDEEKTALIKKLVEY